MINKILNNRFIVLYFLPFFLGLLTVFTFQPFNFSFINFFILPVLFFLIVYVKKNLKIFTEKNPIVKIYSYLVLYLALVFTLVVFFGFPTL